MITGDEATLKLIRQVADSKARRRSSMINSPGGTTEGSEVLYDEIRRLAEKKPVVAVVGSMAASGAYIAALGADRIFVHGNSIVGSIGVLVQYPNVSGLMDKVGVKLEVDQVLAAQGRAERVRADERGGARRDGRARRGFVFLVQGSGQGTAPSERRRTGARFDDGRVFTGRQGLPLKLADAIGGERDAIKWLEAERGVAKDLPVRDWRANAGLAGLKLTSLAAAAADAFGLRSIADALRRSDWANEGGPVDGLVSIWQLSSGD